MWELWELVGFLGLILLRLYYKLSKKGIYKKMHLIFFLIICSYIIMRKDLIVCLCAGQE